MHVYNHAFQNLSCFELAALALLLYYTAVAYPIDGRIFTSFVSSWSPAGPKGLLSSLCWSGQSKGKELHN